MTAGIWTGQGTYLYAAPLLTVDGVPSAIWVNGMMLPPSRTGALRVSALPAWDFGVPVYGDFCGERMLGGHGVVRDRLRELEGLTAFFCPILILLAVGEA